MFSFSKRRRSWVAGLLSAGMPAIAFGQGEGAEGAEVVEAATEAAAEAAAEVASALDSGSIAWILASCALVLLMTPGLALFYAGMVRSKNVLGTMMHSVFCMGLVSVQWVVIGYSLAFGTDVGGFIGGMDYFMLSGVAWDAPQPNSGHVIPHMLFMTFQMMFAIITPALIAGAFAERVRFGPYVLFTLLWATLVYDPICHWVWGGGLLGGDGWLEGVTGYGAIDFAGGTVVHISSGVSALVLAILIGKRRGYPQQKMAPNNLTLTVLGAGLLWFGWFGFNGGSGLASDGTAVLAFTVTHVCAASAALAWAVIERVHHGKATVLGVATGLVAGLVCITPAAGYVQPGAALIMGVIVAAVCYFCVAVLKARLGFDDSLDAFGVHGVGGTVGAILTGVFVSVGGVPSGGLILTQILAVVITMVYSAVVTAILYAIVNAVTKGFRASEDEELQGLDLSQHGEVGYDV